MTETEAGSNKNNYEYYEVTDEQALPKGERLYVEIDDKPVIIFNVDGEYFAIDDECTHDNGPLGDGELTDHHVTCPRHGAKFDIKTGKALTLPAVKNVNTYPIRVTNGKIEIGVLKPE